jgi:hypothetical protein
MSHSNFMKFPIPVVFLATSALVAGCNSLDNPLAGVNLLGSGRDARVYNAQTGEFEWPKDSQKRRTRRPAPAAAGTADTATEPEQRKGDGRYYDPEKSQWVEVREETSHTASAPKPKRPATPPVVLMTTPKPVGTPQPERSPRARGKYNPSTGQIEWTDFDPPADSKPVPEKSDKKWYWPF